MDGKNQPKTKAELLQELQSIQSLLDDQDDTQFPALEDDDIPLLDEFLLEDNEAAAEPAIESGLEDAADEALEADTLDALNAAYAALTDELDAGVQEQRASATPLQEDSDHETPSQSPAQPATHPTTPASRGNASQNPEQTDPQTATQKSDAEQRADEPTDSVESGARDGESPADRLTSSHTDPASPAPLPGQQGLFDAPQKPASGKDQPKPERAPLPQKARGENPFLPQHIRERLKGNQVLPKADFLQPATPPAHQDLPLFASEKPSEKPMEAPVAPPKPEATDITLLTDQLVAEILPVLETRLRELIAERLAHPPHED